MADISTLAVTLLSLMVLYALPTWVTARRLAGSGGWPSVLLVALTLGTGSQAVIGLLWSRLAGGFAPSEALAYLLLWGAASIAFRRPRSGGIGGTAPSTGESFRLGLVLAAAVAVRSIHPLGYAALGQSDAYSHLNNLRDLIELGYLSNPVYPLGFSWILALPALLLKTDPYVLCRFAGAFFGCMLVLALYVLLRRHAGAKAALGGALLAAAFPGFNLLIKTGIGVFPNQIGIFLVPAVLWFALESARSNFDIGHPSSLMTLFALGALAATVPMLLFHLFWVLLAAGVLSLMTPGAPRPPRKKVLLLMTFPVVLLVLLLAIHFSSTSSGLLLNTLGNITSGSEAAREMGRTQPLLAFAVDYFSPKRLGLGGIALNGAGLILGFSFCAVAAAGIAAGNAFLRLLGCWGALGVLHVMFGALQFTAYQREGWSLLEAAVCLGGLAVAVTWKFLGHKPLGRSLAWLLPALLLAWAFWRPPGHLLLNSPAEEAIARLVLSLEKESFSVLDGYGGAPEEESCLAKSCSGDPEGWVVVTRRFNQMGLVRALVGRRPSFLHREIHHDTNLRGLFLPGKCYLVLIDREDSPGLGASGPLSSVSPSLIKSFLKGRKRYFALNRKIESYIDHLDDKGLALTREIRISDNLRALVVYENCGSPRATER